MAFDPRVKLSVCLGVVIIVSLTRQGHAINGTPVWNFTPVAAPQSGMSITAPALAFDHYGVPAIAWTQTHSFDGTSILTRSRATGLGGWQHLTVDSGVNAAFAASMSFDRAERPTVAWVGGTTVKTQFNDITLQTVAGNPGNSRYAIQVYHDLTGTLKGVYTGAATGSLFALSGANGNHTSTSIGVIPNAATIKDVAMTTDYAGRRHLIARARMNSNLDAVVVATEPFSGSAWTMNTLTTVDIVGGVSIATDPTDGRIALAYTTYDGTTSKLFYAKSNGFSLATTEVQTSTSAVFEDIDLKFDLSDGRPAIAFERQVASPFAQQLWFAYMNPSSVWQSGVVDSTIQMNHPTGLNRKPSLAFDDFGTSWPAIAYVDSDGSLQVAVDPPGAAPEPATVAMLALGSMLIRRRRRRA